MRLGVAAGKFTQTGDRFADRRVPRKRFVPAAAALNIPALTSEFCFIDNEEDQKFIDSEEDWQKQARAQCNAILYYFAQVQY